MYELFLKGNSIKSNQSSVKGEVNQPGADNLSALFAECGGVSINKGLYRVHTRASSQLWSDNIRLYFPEIRKTVFPFGYDWLGRQYGIIQGVEHVIVMFDPATVEYYELAADLKDFHNKDLVADRDETVSEASFIPALKKMNITEIAIDKCVGYKVPLFLGGTYDYTNYEITDIEVYWEMQCQMFQQIKDLPPGTKISSIKFKPDNS
jgi:hypothetical protein